MNLPEPVAWIDRDGDVYKETPELSRAPHKKLFTEAQLREALASQAGHPVDELEQENRLMRARIERLQAERDGIVVAILDQIKMANGPRSVSEMVIRNRFMPERPCVVHVPAEDTEGGAL